MIDELKSEEIVNKVGGRFKLTALVQRRLSELLQGSRPLIEDSEGKTMLEIVVQEILQDKIAIDDGLSANITGDEKIAGKVYKITASDTEQGAPVEFTIGFTNTGTVTASPEAELKITKPKKLNIFGQSLFL